MRYWAFIREGNWHGQRLIHATQYHAVHQIVHGRYPEFLSLNTYNPDGTIRSFRLVFDMDSTNVELARHDTAIVVARIGGERSHEVAGVLAHRLFGNLQTLDTKIYRNRSMFRLPYSPASEPGFFKIELGPDELDHPSHYHRQLSSMRSPYQNQTVDRPDYKRLTEMAQESFQTLPVWSTYQPESGNDQERDLIVTPCITRIANKTPVEGERNLTIFILARHHKQFGKTEADTLGELMGNPHLAGLEREIRSVTKSIFGSQREVRCGCKGGSNEATLMRENCDKWCPFSPEKLPTPTWSVR
jgi:hypothetical protein